MSFFWRCLRCAGIGTALHAVACFHHLLTRYWQPRAPLPPPPGKLSDADVLAANASNWSSGPQKPIPFAACIGVTVICWMGCTVA